MGELNIENPSVIKCICLGCKAETFIRFGEDWQSNNHEQDAFPDSFEKVYGICPSCRDKISKMFSLK